MKKDSQSGQIIILAVIFMALLLMASASLVSYSFMNVRNSRQVIAASQALYAAEAGVDKAVYELNLNPSYSGETDTVLGDAAFSVSIESLSGNSKRVTSTGYIPGNNSTQATKTVKALFSIDNNSVAFNYGVQAGTGGFLMNGGSLINGNVYANGNIVATNGVHITGSATAANPPALAADQANDSPVPISSCTAGTCVTFANNNATQDFAQSFRISDAVAMNSVQFYIKKVSTPGDAVVRVVTDNAGSPGSTVLMTGTLLASSVTTDFGWATVALPSTPVLDPSQTYWLVIDAAANSSRYYIIGANSSYGNGTAKIGRYGTSWSNTSPAGLDGYFKIFLGGGSSYIGGSTYSTGVYVGTTGADNAWAHEVKGATVSGNIYCQTGSDNNKSCDTSKPDPDPEPLPLSDANIQAWKDEAAAGGTLSGDYHVGWAGGTLGPKKITGNLTVDGGGILTVSGTLWIEGTITLSGGGQIQLASSYGGSNGVIITDGYVVLNGGSNFAGSGQPGSYIFLITTSACPAAPECAGNDAITLSGGAGTVAIVAQNGNVTINGGGALKAVAAKQVTMSGGATLTYDSGLINASFTSGPGGAWAFVPGSYVIVP